ncbi:hypothetical protein [Paraburkholderia caribensis]|jgi:hypothetical protein|uniref:hypothetical protein n=1 Tax=Paraburkholderia caribensis TaxID=75105 RepID=UPI0015921EBB|nr:hypothetical protein [Paraburkholderia caribensis]
MAKFKPDERQRHVIELARQAHGDMQANNPAAPDSLVKKTSLEVGIDPSEKKSAKKKSKRAQKKGLLKMIRATERMGLYDKELEDLPVRRKR